MYGPIIWLVFVKVKNEPLMILESIHMNQVYADIRDRELKDIGYFVVVESREIACPRA